MTIKQKIHISKDLQIGTRASPLALWQAHETKRQLEQAYPDVRIDLVPMNSSGEWNAAEGESRLCTLQGGKGLFTKQLEEALLSGRIDLAVHSMKDVETFMPEGLEIAAMLPREDVRDALIIKEDWRVEGRKITSFSDIPQGALIGSASARRQAQILSLRPDLNVVPFRGNVQTRIEKCRSGKVDASFLALAGLRRLDLAQEVDCILPLDQVAPCAGQGAIGVQIAKENAALREALQVLNHPQTYSAVMMERGALSSLDGSCHTPIGAYAFWDHVISAWRIRLEVFSLDGKEKYIHTDFLEVLSHPQEAWDFGVACGAALRQQIPSHILQQYAAG